MKDREFFFKEHLKTMSVSLAFWRAFESARFAKETLTAPVLDVGCGDGLFAKTVFEEKMEAGIDLNPGEVARAAKSGFYKETHCVSVTSMPFEDGRFKTVISNCVLEHVPPIEEAMKEIARVMAPGAKFIFTVTSENYNTSFLGAKLLHGVGLKALSKLYVDFVNYAFKHFNVDTHETWKRRLEQVGLEMVSWEYIISPPALRRHERWFLPAIPSKLWKRLFGRWVLFPRFFVGWVAPFWFRKTFQVSDEGGVCYFIVAKKP